MESSSEGRKLSKSASGLRMVPVSDMYASPFALAEPQWVSDKDFSSCPSCNKSFDFFNRRHHCRRCGSCFCDPCSHHVLPLKRMYFMDPVRHCYECAVISKAEAEFYDKFLNVLFQGTQLSVENTEGDVQFGILDCKLSSDHRVLRFTPTNKSKADSPPSNISLSKVLEVKFNFTECETGEKSPIGFKISYKDEIDSAITHSLVVTMVDKRSFLLWISAFQKAVKMIFESRNVANA